MVLPQLWRGMQHMPATRYRTLSRRWAVAVLLLTMALMAVLVQLSLHCAPPASATGSLGGDMALYGRIVDRLRQGQAYYPAAHAELLAGGYGTESVFNWRMPLYPWLLSLFPNLWLAQASLAVLALAAMAASVKLLHDVSRGLAVWATILLLLSLAACFAAETLLFSELTCGVLILLSAAAYGLRWHWVGFAAGVAALFVRELAAPYILVALVFAWREKRYPELIGWGVALLVYAAYFLWHMQMVHGQLGPQDRAYADGWVQLGGLQFVLATAQFNGVLAILPLWVSAIVLPLAALGLAAWPGRTGAYVALTVAAYLGLFLAIGKPFNNYWGLLYTPLLTLGLAWLPAAVFDLAGAAVAAPKLAASDAADGL
jgi:hypothetical protein